MYELQFTFTDLVGWFLAACGGVVTIGAAVSVIAKMIMGIKKPNTVQDERLTRLEQRVDEHDRLFKSDNDRLHTIEDGNRVTQAALLALLDHSLDGNNIEQMREAKAGLQRHLLER